MDVIPDKVTHPIARAALVALQKGDKAAWSVLFHADAKLFDDGSPRDLKGFSADALGTEWFTSIDEVENGGLRVVGNFHSEKWGDFRVYFEFRVGADELIHRLDIGQAGGA